MGRKMGQSYDTVHNRFCNVDDHVMIVSSCSCLVMQCCSCSAMLLMFGHVTYVQPMFATGPQTKCWISAWMAHPLLPLPTMYQVVTKYDFAKLVAASVHPEDLQQHDIMSLHCEHHGH